MFQSLRYQIHVLFTRIRHFVMDDTSSGIIPFADYDGNNPVPLEAVPASNNPLVRHADDIFLTKVCWSKRRSSPYHEFLIFYVKKPGEPGKRIKKSVILVERGVYEHAHIPAEAEDEQPDSEGNYELQVQSSEEAPSTPPRVPRPSVVETITTSPSSLSFSFSFSSDRPSEDVLTFSGNGDDLFIRQRLPDADVYRKLEIGEQTFSLAQLVVLVRVVHDHHRGYRLLEYQCYWFARVIYDAIQARGRECIESVYNGPRQLGKFDRIGVKLGKRDTLAIVLRKYDTAWAIVKNEIQQKRWRQQKAAEDAEKAKRIDQEILARQQADQRADMEAHARQEACATGGG
ncbi:hypothetical protein K439DRAFT_1638016, partial [Ramaria rubella]